jgi:acyl-CoA synthetase (AMP-forming)/AMP-acid ligase II
MYGLTECKRVSYLPPDELSRRPDSVGIPIPGTQAWIEDANGQVVGPGRVGELMVRGPHVMQGYWGDPDATSERLRQGRWPWDRTLRTGDLFRCDEEGYLYFVGRQDDMIKSRGERVYPREIEQVLLAAPSVLEAAVVGIADERLGQAICAHVVEQPGQEINVDQLYRFCEEHLEAPLVPRQIIVHDRLPTTAHGKVDRRSLARMEPNPDLARQP